MNNSVDYTSQETITQSGWLAFKNGVARHDCPMSWRSQGSAILWWTQGWDKAEKSHVKVETVSLLAGSIIPMSALKNMKIRLMEYNPAQAGRTTNTIGAKCPSAYLCWWYI